MTLSPCKDDPSPHHISARRLIDVEALIRSLLTPRVAAFALAFLVFIFTTAGVKAWWDVGQMYSSRFDGVSPRGPHEDYVVFYSAGTLVREGFGNFLYDINTIAHTELAVMGRSVGGTGVLAFFNPPFVAAAFAPLSSIPVEGAAAIIGVISTVIALAAGYALQRLLKLRSFYEKLLFWLGFLSMHSVSWVVLHGQFSLLLMLGWLLFIACQLKGRHALSGVALSLLLIKPQLALLPIIVLVWKRQWWALATFATIAWVALMTSIAVGGTSVLIDYPRFLLDSAGWENKWGITPASMYGWSGFLARILDNNSPPHLIATWSLNIATAVAALSVFRGEWSPAKPRFLLQCAALLTAALLINPHLYMQDLSLMVLPLALGAAYAMRTGRNVLPWVVLALAVWLAQHWGLSLLDDAGINVLTPMLLLLFGVLLYVLRQPEGIREEVEARPGIRIEKGVRTIYLLQGAYLAFIVAFSIGRGTFLMPDVILLFLVAGFVWGQQRLRFLRDFAPFVLLLFSYDAMRGFADNLSGTVHIGYPMQLERLLFFGHIPTQELQRRFADLYHTHWYDSLAALLHAAHFVVPLIFAAVIWQHRRDQYWRFISTLLLVSYAGFVTFMLLPTAPPWWAAREGYLDDVLLLHLSPHTAFLYDKLNPNPVAAMPSLHAAYPWLFFLFAVRLWGKKGIPVIVYPFSVFISSVYLGHHYVVDILGGVLCASAGYVLVCGPVVGWVRRAIQLRPSLIARPSPAFEGAPMLLAATPTGAGKGTIPRVVSRDLIREEPLPMNLMRRMGKLVRSHARWEVALYAAIILLALALRFYDLGARAFHGDEAVHAGFAWQLFDGRGYEHNPLTHGPFQFFGTAGVFLLLGDSDFTARLLPAVFGAALVALPLLFRAHLGRTGALLTSLMLAVSPTLLYYSRFAREDIYMAFFTLALVTCVWRYLAVGRRPYLYAIAGLLALSFCTKEVAFIVTAIIMVYLAILLAKELAAQMGHGSMSGWLPGHEKPDEDARSHYAVLGLPERVSARTLRRAYFRMVRDGSGRSEGDAERIEEAYRVLSDRYERQKYDRLLSRERREHKEEGGGEAKAKGWLRESVALAALLPLGWLVAAFWPLIGGPRRRLALHTLPRSGHLIVLIGCLSLPLCSAAIEKLPFIGDRGYDVAEELVMMRVTVLALITAAFAVGLMWRWRVWMVSWAVFYSIFIALYTSFFTNPDGFWTGIWGSLDYWMGQQYVHLGDQPGYYYMMLLPVYEFLPLAIALGTAAVFVLRGELRHKAIAVGALTFVVALALAGNRAPIIGPFGVQIGFIAIISAMLLLPMSGLTRLLFYWTLSALFAFTLAGEKMPWLNVHIALPLCVLAGRSLGSLLSGLELRVQVPRQWLPAAGAAALSAVAVAVFLASGTTAPEALAGWAGLLAAGAAIIWVASSMGRMAGMRVAAMAVASILTVFTVRAGVLSSWGHPGLLEDAQTLASRDRGDTPVELLVFVQSSPDIPVIRDAIDDVAEASGKGTELPIFIDARENYHWPWAWYLRKYENISFIETDDPIQPPAGSVVLASWRDREKLQIDPALFVEGIRYHHRWWFPEEYKGLSSAEVLAKLVNPESWASWRAYFVSRTPPAGIPALDAVAYFPRDERVSDVLSTVVHKEP